MGGGASAAPSHGRWAGARALPNPRDARPVRISVVKMSLTTGVSVVSF